MKILAFTALLLMTYPVMGIEIKGVRAEALFKQMRTISEDVKALENSVDCAMGGSCLISFKDITCVKDTSTQNKGNVLSCSILSKDAGVVTVLKADSHSMSPFRRTLIEVSGNLVNEEERNSVSVKLIECKGIGLGFEEDDLDIEEKYKCTLE